jgi:hypothetical protein
MRWMIVVFVAGLALSVAQGTAPVKASPLSLAGRGAGGEGTYSPQLAGQIAASRLSGVEPDGDPLYQVVLQTKLAASQGLPAVHLIVSAYLENFQPDTTPILPDLLRPNQNAQNLGGFLQGKALLTDNAGNVLYIGSLVAEAFLDNTNHVAMTLTGSGTAFGDKGKLLGAFTLHKDGSLTGSLKGTLALSASARRQILANHGARMKPLKDIISVVTVRPHPMVGRATGGVRTTPLPSNFAPPPQSSGGSSHVNPWSIVAAVGAVLSLVVAGVLYMMERHRAASRV